MKRFLLLFTLSIVIFWGCVDDYQEANPATLLDAPAVHRLSLSDSLITDTETTTLSIFVVDAPAGLDSVGVNDVTPDGDPVGGTFSITSNFAGLTEGTVDVTYQPAANYSGVVVLQAQVFDGQVDEDGESAAKSSVLQTIELDVICGTIAGEYNVNGEIIRDDFGSGPYSGEDILSLVDCTVTTAYAVTDITGGLYTGSYADAYGTDAAGAVLNIDFTTGEVTWSGVSDQFGGEIIQDPTQPASNYDSGSGEITVYWMATAWGEQGITTYSMQ